MPRIATSRLFARCLDSRRAPGSKGLRELVFVGTRPRMQEATARGPELALGVVGVGRWGRHWARVCTDVTGGRLVAVCDSNPAQRTELPARAGQVPWFTSAE